MATSNKLVNLCIQDNILFNNKPYNSSLLAGKLTSLTQTLPVRQAHYIKLSDFSFI